MTILPSHHYQFSALLTAISSLLLVLLVYRKSVNKHLKIQFTFYYASLFLWSLSVFVCTSVFDYQVSYLFNQMTHVAAIMIPVFFLHFTLVYLGRLKSVSEKIMMAFFYCIALFFEIVVIFFSRSFFLDIEPKLSFPFFPTDGRFYTPWVFTFALAVITAHAVLFLELLRSKGIRKKQISFFLIANLLGYFGGIGCFLPVYDLPYFPFPYGPYGVFLLSLVSGYTILKHRFIDLEILVKRTIVFGSLFGAIFALFSFVLLVFQRVLFTYMTSNPFLSTAISILFIVMIYDPLRRSLVQLTDRFLFQKKIDYRKFLKEASEYLSHLDSLKRQSRRIVAFLIKKARITNVSIYVFTSRDPSGLILEAARPLGNVSAFEEISLTHPIIQLLYRHKGPLEFASLTELLKGEPDPAKKSEYESVLNLMNSFHAEAVIPCYGGRAAAQARRTELHLRGILFLGSQKSDEPYSEEDLDVFFTLGQESSIAFENARLYDEAIEKAKELELINQELNDAQTKVLRALSETEAANKKLEMTHAQLIVAEKKATRVGMAQAIGHEVYNPLVPISGNAQLIYMDHIKVYSNILEKYGKLMSEDDSRKFTKTIKETDKSAHGIVNSTNRVKGVVQTLTGTLKEGSGDLGPLNLPAFFQRVLDVSRFTTGEENISGCDIRLDIAENLWIIGNDTQLSEVFLNLLKNAYEAMGQKENRRIEIRGRIDSQDPKMARIEFADNGPGISPENLPRIWKHGFSTKIKKDDSIGASGQGLGLFVCKHIIEDFHKGTITVASTLGKGTTFIVMLHLTPNEDAGQTDISG